MTTPPPEELRLRALLRHISDTITVFGPDGTVLWTGGNPGGTLGRSDDEWVGEPGLEHVHPGDRDMVTSLLVQLLEMPGGELSADYRVLTADGGVEHIEGTAVNLLDDPLVEGIVQTSRNITARKRTEMLLRAEARILAAIATGSPVEDVMAAIDELVIEADPEADSGVVESARNLAAIARERARAEGHLARLALHDPLTDLPNRTLLLDRLSTAVRRIARHEYAVAVLFVDVDRFKLVNDRYGHRGGDELLIAIAGRLQEAVRPGDTVARLGGDEFVAVCEDVVDLAHARSVAKRLEHALDEPFKIGDDDDVVITASVGVALSTSADADAETLLRDADAAMYRAKQEGRARVAVFDRRMREQVEARAVVERELRHGVATGQITAHYQPVVDLSTGRIVAVEALARWQHPERGLLLPVAFLDVADDIGLLAEVETEVLALGVAEGGRWRALDIDLSINVAPAQLTDSTFPIRVLGVIERAGWPAARLVLEVTEAALLGASSSVLATLREAGVRLMLDDYGTGPSSVGQLPLFPVDAVKIDRSFVQRIDADGGAVVRATVAVAGALGLQVIAEGVATPHQRVVVGALGCRLAQGYLFGRPVPADELD